jgi:two-component system response regulator DctR
VSPLNIPRIRVVLIEDDPMVQEVNREFVNKVDGYEVVGVASNGVEGIERIALSSPDLVLMDIYMPLMDGLETLSQLRANFQSVDVIAITAARDASSIQRMMRGGVVDYIIKPFKFERVKQALEQYRAYRYQLKGKEAVSQEELDRLWRGNDAADSAGSGKSVQDVQYSSPYLHPNQIPKGLNAITLKQVVGMMRKCEGSLSAEEVAEGVGIARVTARRYLEYLEKAGELQLEVKYGGVGRPINRYSYKRDQNDHK